LTAMELTRRYYIDIAEPQLKKEFPELYAVLAAGLVGNGSECFGYDDEISRDHDWGIDFFIWLPEERRSDVPVLQKWKDTLFMQHPPAYIRERSNYGATLGVMTAGDFYKSLIGYPEGPSTIMDWRRVPEENLAMATNGNVFVDNSGVFTDVRNRLLQFYPEDLRLKKLAARCMAIAQTGQYNVRRCFRRKDFVALRGVLTRFSENVISAVFLINKVYKPYYKWAFRKMTTLPELGAELSPHLTQIALSGIEDQASFTAVTESIDFICRRLRDVMKLKGLASSDDWFLTTQAEELQQKIQDSFLRSLPTQYE
jgi:hypothetical protein